MNIIARLESGLLDRYRTINLPGTRVARTSTSWHEEWDGELSDALAVLPENPALPHQLLELLMKSASSRRASVVVYEAGRPIGILPLRAETHTYWVPLTSGWLETGDPCISRPEDALRCLVATKADLRRVYTLYDGGVSGCIRSAAPMAEYTIAVDETEAYWHQSGHWRTVRKARNRAAGLGLVTDKPGAAKWVLRNWARKWGTSAWQDDYALALDYFEAIGRLHCFTLEDDGRLVGGAMALEMGDMLLGTTLYRDPGVELTRLLEHKVEFAREHGFRMVGWGAGGLDSYKRKWAPPREGYAQLEIAPWPVHAIVSTKSLARRLMQRGRPKQDGKPIADPTSADPGG